MFLLSSVQTRARANIGLEQHFPHILLHQPLFHLRFHHRPACSGHRDRPLDAVHLSPYDIRALRFDLSATVQQATYHSHSYHIGVDASRSIHTAIIVVGFKTTRPAFHILSNTPTDFREWFGNLRCFLAILPLVAIYAIWLLISFLFLDPWVILAAVGSHFISPFQSSLADAEAEHPICPLHTRTRKLYQHNYIHVYRSVRIRKSKILPMAEYLTLRITSCAPGTKCTSTSPVTAI
jgi:hypothetical protein